GDVIAVRTRLGGVFVGTIFLAGATSLPELIASVSSFQIGAPNLAAGNLFGSNMVNVLLLALVDLITFQVPLMRKVAISHALTATLTTILMLMAAIAIMGDFHSTIGWVGTDSLIIVAVYFGGVWLIQRESHGPSSSPAPVAIEPGPEFPSLRRGLVGFAAVATALVLVVPQLVNASSEIATLTGMGTGFVGTALLSIVTSLPELLAALAAVRMGAFDMAVGNLFGSSVFNMLGVGIADFFYTDGRFLAAIDPNFALVALLGMLLTNMALLGNLARVERKILFLELDTLAIVVVYILGMYLLFARGVGL
ncbi:MAG: sodium:calcium antiporter, partial [Chloroflexi bacterium]|nr:sodium:calcium antiporter [Chloroflexota bacterium]